MASDSWRSTTQNAVHQFRGGNQNEMVHNRRVQPRGGGGDGGGWQVGQLDWLGGGQGKVPMVQGRRAVDAVQLDTQLHTRHASSSG